MWWIRSNLKDLIINHGNNNETPISEPLAILKTNTEPSSSSVVINLNELDLTKIKSFVVSRGIKYQRYLLANEFSYFLSEKLRLNGINCSLKNAHNNIKSKNTLVHS